MNSFSLSIISGSGGGRRCQPGTGLSSAKVNLMTLKTGCNQLMEGGKRRRYALFPTFLTTGKGPSLRWESFQEGRVVWMSLASKYTLSLLWLCKSRMALRQSSSKSKFHSEPLGVSLEVWERNIQVEILVKVLTIEILQRLVVYILNRKWLCSWVMATLWVRTRLRWGSLCKYETKEEWHKAALRQCVMNKKCSVIVRAFSSKQCVNENKVKSIVKTIVT